MIFTQNINNWNLLLKLQKFYHKSGNYKELWFPNYFKRCSYRSFKERKTEEPFTLQFYSYPNIFRSKKTPPQACLSSEVIDMLCEIFEVDNDEKFRRIFLYQKYLGKCSEKHLRNTALYLRELNITEEHIIFAPGILLYKKDDIEAKRQLIEHCCLFKNIRDGLGFVSFHPGLIDRYNKQFEKEYEEFCPYRNRIYYIGGKLNLPIDFFTLKLVKEWRILSLEKRRLDLFIDLFSEFKCRPMAIISDLNIFFHKYDTVKKRLNEVSQIKGSLPHRLYWTFSSEKTFQRYYERAKKYENCFMDDLVEVLIEELQLSEEDALDFITGGRLERCTPKILCYKIRKYKEEGFTREAFVRSPHILGLSENRILKRIKILKEKGVFKYAKFYSLSRTDDYFNECVKSLQILKENLESQFHK